MASVSQKQKGQRRSGEMIRQDHLAASEPHVEIGGRGPQARHQKTPLDDGDGQGGMARSLPIGSVPAAHSTWCQDVKMPATLAHAVPEPMEYAS